MFFFNDTATTEIYTLSLHYALPILQPGAEGRLAAEVADAPPGGQQGVLQRVLGVGADRKSTRLNSSHANISYAVFCLKKKTTAILCDRMFSVNSWSSRSRGTMIGLN